MAWAEQRADVTAPSWPAQAVVELVERVRVWPGAGRVEVTLRLPWSDRADAAAVTEYLQVLRQLQQACAQRWPDVEWCWLPPQWPHPPAQPEVAAVLAACIEEFASQEPLAGQWLRLAERLLQRVPSPTALAAEEPVWLAVLQLPSEPQRAALARKAADHWLQAEAARAFGLQVEVRLQVAAQDEQADRLRQTLADLERQEVALVLEQRARAEAQAGAAGQPGRGERVDKPDGSAAEGWRNRRDRQNSEPVEPLTLGRGVSEPLTPLREIVDEMRRVAVEGRVFGVETRTLPSGRQLVQFYLTDDTDSITAKVFVQGERQQQALEPLTDGVYVRIQGQVQFDAYAKELVFLVSDMQPAQAPERLDTAAEKRVELHLHTTLSALDAVTPVADYVQQAARWGHEALAVTDHGVVQA
ncbi:MAG: PHP domain-containing protein, partial [Alicyclobacillus sp.]|nr:PHP domain-containing protein [Alicyclobacillus sp.]